MKNLKFKILTLLLLSLILGNTSGIFAQGYGQGQRNGYGRINGTSRGYYCNYIPNLTEEQQAKLETLRNDHWKNIQNNSNLLSEKAAHLQTLRSADNVDMKEINKIIDEMNSIRTSIQKSREKHIQDVRNILTKEQRIYFDNFQSQKGKGYGSGPGRCKRGYVRGGISWNNGNTAGYCRGYGRGMGPCGRF